MSSIKAIFLIDPRREWSTGRLRLLVAVALLATAALGARGLAQGDPAALARVGAAWALGLVFLARPAWARPLFQGVHALVLYAFHLFTLAALTAIYFLLITPMNWIMPHRAPSEWRHAAEPLAPDHFERPF